MLAAEQGHPLSPDLFNLMDANKGVQHQFADKPFSIRLNLGRLSIKILLSA